MGGIPLPGKQVVVVVVGSSRPEKNQNQNGNLVTALDGPGPIQNCPGSGQFVTKPRLYGITIAKHGAIQKCTLRETRHPRFFVILSIYASTPGAISTTCRYEWPTKGNNKKKQIKEENKGYKNPVSSSG